MGTDGRTDGSDAAALLDRIVGQLERANARLELLSRAGVVLNASLDLTQILSGLGEVVVPDLADHCVVDLTDADASAPTADPGSPLLRSAVVHRPDATPPAPSDDAGPEGDPWTPVGARVRYPAGHPVHEALRTGGPVVHRIDPAEFDYDAVAPGAASARFARLVQIRSAVAVPLRVQGRTVGVLSLAYSISGRLHGEEDVRLAEQLADRAAVAIDNARLHLRERRRGLILQRSLLPEQLPAAPGLSAAARYLPAGGSGEVGGDWYDLIRLPGGRVAIVVGDVMGRGVPAAALMGQLRAALRAYAVQDQSPSQVLSSADQLVRGLADDIIVTCVYAVLDPRDGSLVLANAGHVPPLLVTGDPARPWWSLASTGPPLGAGGPEPYGERAVRLLPGQLLALYTDGLVERRDIDLQTAIARFADLLPTADEDLEAGCDRIVGQAGQDDDAALLLVRLDESTRPEWVRFTLAADARAAQIARAISGRTLAGWDEPAPLRDAAELAVSELVTNAWRHGTPPLGLRLSRHDDGVVIEVLDADPRSPRVHRAASDDEGGRGLFLVDAVSRAWGVRFLGAGKVVWCHLARWQQQTG